MREITTHHTNECNRRIELVAHEPDPETGAPSAYDAHWLEADGSGIDHEFFFHSGAVADGINGITNELCIAILMDRLQGWQTGQYQCPENEQCLDLLRQVMTILAARSQLRDERGVEGTRQL